MMKPERLMLEGVYSYKKPAEIDFSTLCEAELFGIFGNVGSGKSAILEAVTYVLFGKIERLPSKMMNYNMMNLSSDRMFIEFEFSHKGATYRFNFEAKRNRKDFEKIESPKRNAYRLEEGAWLPLFDRDSEVSAEGIIGLNYDNFRRTIIVPQGRFQEFLHLEKSKRTEMLMELFRLNRFNLFSKAAALSGANSEKIAVLEERIENLSGATEEAVAAAEEEYEKLHTATDNLSSAIEKSDAALNGMNEISRLGKAVAEADARLEKIRSAEPEFEARRKRLSVFEECREKLKPLLDRCDAAAREHELKTKQLAEAGKRLKTAVGAAEAAEKVFGTISARFDGIGQLKSRNGWLTDMSRLKQERVSLLDTGKAVEKAEAEISDLRTGLEKINADLASTAAELETCGKAEKSAEQMAAISFAFRALKGKQEEASAAVKSLKELERRLAGVAEKTAAAGSPDSDEEKIERRREELDKRILDREVLKSLGGLAAGLQPGVPCPLCGSPDHPAPADMSTGADAGIEAEKEELERELRLVRERRDELASLRSESGIIESNIKISRENALRIEDEIAELKSQVEEAGYPASEYQVFEAGYREFLSNSERRENLLKKQDGLNKDKEKLASALNDAMEKNSRLKVGLGRSETIVGEIEARIDPEFLKQHQDFSLQQLGEKAGMLESEIAEIELGFKAAEQARTEASMNRQRSESEVDLLGKQAAGLETERAGLGQELEKAVSELGFKDEQEVRGILAEISSAASERSEIERFEKEKARADKESAVLLEQLAGRTYDAGLHREEQENNAGLKDEYRKAVNRQGELGNILSGLKQDIERRLESEKALQQLMVRGENLRLLKNLFRGNEFANYAARVYLSELCESANSRFRKLTREALRLELDENNNFIIRDYLNEGKTRSVKTLSGGQTFQAAFSLSLALADSIGRERSGFFFLDEGFGSLDRESLSLVFDTLKSLKKEKRTVGIISHVEELKQEIDTFVTVKKDDDEGSLIKSSWE